MRKNHEALERNGVVSEMLTEETFLELTDAELKAVCGGSYDNGPEHYHDHSHDYDHYHDHYHNQYHDHHHNNYNYHHH